MRKPFRSLLWGIFIGEKTCRERRGCGREPGRQCREAVEQEYRLGNRKSC